MQITTAIRTTFVIVLSLTLLASVFAISMPSPDSQVVGSGERVDQYRLIVAASKDANGVDGQATFVDTIKNSKIKIDITDITIVSTDGMAILTGIVTSTSGGSFGQFGVGEQVSFYVEDNGEGNDAVPDSFSLPNEKPGKPKGGTTFPEVVHGNLRVVGASDKGEVIEVPK